MSTIKFRNLTKEEEKYTRHEYMGIVVNVNGIDYLIDNDIYFTFDKYIYHIKIEYYGNEMWDTYSTICRQDETFNVNYNLIDDFVSDSNHVIEGPELDKVAAHIQQTCVKLSDKLNHTN